MYVVMSCFDEQYSEHVLEQSGAQIHSALCGRLTVSFEDCGRE